MTILTTSQKRRSGHDNPERGDTLRGSVTKGRVEPTPKTQFAVYDGTARLGSFRRDGDSFIAFDRLGRPLGTFDSQQAAIDAIDSGGAP
jgi:hypothetical protein